MTDAPNTVHWQYTPIEHIAVGVFVPPLLQQEREAAFADWLNIDRGLVYQAPFGGHPVILYPGDDIPRREWYPELDATTAWLPLLWPSIDQADRTSYVETDDEFALRVLLDMHARKMYDLATGEWFPIWAVWESVPDGHDEWTDRINTWLDGVDDEVVDCMEPAPLPDGTDPDQSYRDSQLSIDALMESCGTAAVTWSLDQVRQDPSTMKPDEQWLTLCQVADALSPFSVKWAGWFERELPNVSSVFEAAAATGVRGSADRQANRLFAYLREVLSGLTPLA